MASITVMKNYVIKKAQGTTDDNLKKIVKVLKNYNNLDAETKKKVGGAVEKIYNKFKAQESKKSESKTGGEKKSTGGSKKKYQAQDFKSVLLAFKNKIGAKAFKEATTGTTIKQDSERPALPKGKRKVTKKGYTTNAYGTFKNKVGRAYWENRANRFDSKQPPKNFPKLAEGGAVEEVKYLKSDGVSQSTVSNKKEATPMRIMDAEYYISSNPKNNAMAIAEKIDKSLPDRVGKNYIIKIVPKKDKKFAKGGIVEHGLKKGDKVVDSFENIVIVENNNEKFFINLNLGKRYSNEQWMKMDYGKLIASLK